MKPRKQITVSTFDESSDASWTPDEFLMKIAAAIAQIPEKERASGGNGRVDLDGGDNYGVLKIYYSREETEREYNDRIARENAWEKKR